MIKERHIENIFFFALFGVVGYLLWQIVAPFIASLALAAIIAVIWHPVFRQMVRFIPKRNTTAAALLSVIVIAVTIFVPLAILGYMLFLQIISFYDSLSNTAVKGLQNPVVALNDLIANIFPGASVDVTGYLKSIAEWMVAHTGTIFASTASTLFLMFIMFVALYYMLKDGPQFLQAVVRLSPLPDTQDEYILHKLSISIRSVVLGTLSVAFIQGVLTSIGFAFFGMPQPILWGSVAAFGALIPGVGTSLVFIGAILFLLVSHSYGIALGLGIWGIFAVGLIDNLLGPYLMSRGAELHPFMVLLSVLGGVTLLGPVGLLLGPVLLSFFSVLLELYISHQKVGKKHAG